MEDMRFEKCGSFKVYGKLKWLDPKEFFTGSWNFMAREEGEDGNMYDLVSSEELLEVRYTNIKGFLDGVTERLIAKGLHIN